MHDDAFANVWSHIIMFDGGIEDNVTRIIVDYF